MFRPSPSSLTLTGATDSPADTNGSVTSNELLCGSRGPAEVVGDINVSSCTCADEMETKQGGAGSTRALRRDSNFSHHIKILPHLKEMFTFFKLESRLPDIGNNTEHDVPFTTNNETCNSYTMQWTGSSV